MICLLRVFSQSGLHCDLQDLIRFPRKITKYTQVRKILVGKKTEKKHDEFLGIQVSMIYV